MPTASQRADLDRWLSAHHQVVSSSRLRAFGLYREFAEVQVRAGRWQRVHRGVYCAHTGPLGFESRCAGALAACGVTAALTGLTALGIHGMRRRDDTTIHVVVPHTVAAPDLVGVRVSRCSTLSSRAVLTRRGLSVVRPEHAAVEAALRHPRDAAAVMTEAVQQGITTAVHLRAAILARGRVNGRRRLLEITHGIEGGDRSALERRVRLLIRRAGLPAPVQNHPLRLDGRQLWLDMCYPALRIAIEVDGRAYHLLSEDWDSDLARQNLVVLDGWLVLRFTALAVREHPDAVVDQVRRAVDSRLLVALAG